MNNQEKGIWFVFGLGSMGVFFSLVLGLSHYLGSDAIEVGDIIYSEEHESYGIVIGDKSEDVVQGYYQVYPIKIENWDIPEKEEVFTRWSK